jgi:hypothetical protein
MTQLPPKPDWFNGKLAEVHTHYGKPFFRVVDGTRETEFLNDNPRSIKHWDLVPGKGRVPRECWVIEYYQPPEEISETSWAFSRYQELNVFGVPRIVDSLGPYPSDGRYKHYKDLRIKGTKTPLPLTMRVIEDLKAEVANYYLNNNKTADEELAASEINAEEWERDRIQQKAQDFYDAHGVAAQKMFHNVATSTSPAAPEPSDNQRRIWLPGDKL